MLMRVFVAEDYHIPATRSTPLAHVSYKGMEEQDSGR